MTGKPLEPRHDCWERAVQVANVAAVILALIAVVISVWGTCHSVKTSQKAIEQINVDLRPRVFTGSFDDVTQIINRPCRIELQVPVLNSGKVPAHGTVKVWNEFTGPGSHKSSRDQREPTLLGIVPGQESFRISYSFVGEVCSDTLKGIGETTIHFAFEYGATPGSTQYHYNLVIRFEYERLKDLLEKRAKRQGLWEFVSLKAN